MKKANGSWGQYVNVYDAFGRKAAEYGAGFNGDCTTCYPVTDTVGALRLVANENGDAVRRFDWTGQGPGIHDYNTFANGRTGIQWSPSTVVNVQWAGGYQRDDLPLEPNVEFSGTRTMKRHHGRFWSPDENLVDQDPADPLSWNLYAYARGNPVTYSDPTGMECVEGWDEDLPGPCVLFVVDVEGKKPNREDRSSADQDVDRWFLGLAVGHHALGRQYFSQYPGTRFYNFFDKFSTGPGLKTKGGVHSGLTHCCPN